QTMSVNARLRTEQTVDQLLVAHFEREDADDGLVHVALRPRGGVLRDVQTEGRVVNADVVGDEVMCFGDGQVINLLVTKIFDGNDFIPVNVALGQFPARECGRRHTARGGAQRAEPQVWRGRKNGPTPNPTLAVGGVAQLRKEFAQMNDIRQYQI